MFGRSRRKGGQCSMTLTSPSSDVREGSAPESTPPRTLPTHRPSRTRAIAFVIVRKLISAIVVLWGAATVAFFAQLALPGDRATVILNIRDGQAQQRTAAEL